MTPRRRLWPLSYVYYIGCRTKCKLMKTVYNLKILGQVQYLQVRQQPFCVEPLIAPHSMNRLYSQLSGRLKRLSRDKHSSLFESMFIHWYLLSQKNFFFAILSISVPEAAARLNPSTLGWYGKCSTTALLPLVQKYPRRGKRVGKLTLDAYKVKRIFRTCVSAAR
jgi:hypothetical protein